jgi:nitrogen fixation NifU-like protein
MNPRNVGEIQDADGIGTVGNPKCGDIMKLYIKVENKDDKKIIVDAKFKTFGCGAAIATSSVLTEKIKGKDIDEVLKLTNKDIMDELGGLPPVKIHCSCLAEQALHAAIFDYAKKNNLVFKNLKQPKNVCPCACKKNN